MAVIAIGVYMATSIVRKMQIICEKQTKMIAKDHTKYSSEKYKHLEKLKVLIKDM